MNKFVESNVHANMRNIPPLSPEENQVAVLNIALTDTVAAFGLFLSGARKFGIVEFQKQFLHKLTAIKTFGVAWLSAVGPPQITLDKSPQIN